MPLPKSYRNQKCCGLCKHSVSFKGRKHCNRDQSFTDPRKETMSWVRDHIVSGSSGICDEFKMHDDE